MLTIAGQQIGGGDAVGAISIQVVLVMEPSVLVVVFNIRQVGLLRQALAGGSVMSRARVEVTIKNDSKCKSVSMPQAGQITGSGRAWN